MRHPSTVWANSWSETNKNPIMPAVHELGNSASCQTKAMSTFWLWDTSYIRLKNVTIGYDFSNILRKINHFGERNSSCLLYFSGENLFTLTKYSGMDPECGGWDGLKYPVSRVLSVGVKLTY